MGKVNQPRKTIYFIAGLQATADELADTEQFQPGVVLRCASKVVPGEPVEPFDRVAGAVPPDYANSDGKPRPAMTKRERRALDRQRVEEQGERPVDRRSKPAVPLRSPSAPAPAPTGPQGTAWGTAPAAATSTPSAPGSRPVWKPNA